MNAQTTSRFEPMTIGMILDTTVRLYLHNFSLMIGITPRAYLPYLILLLVSSLRRLVAGPECHSVRGCGGGHVTPVVLDRPTALYRGCDLRH